MPWTAERTTVNQKVQIGAEATTDLGVAMTCNRIIECFTWSIGIKTDAQTFRGTGRKYPAVQELNREWVEFSIDGNFDYNGIIYVVAGVFGNATAALHAPSSTVYDWIFTPPLTGSIVPRTYTIEQGDSIRAHRCTYGLFTGWGYKGNRNDFTMSAKGIAKNLTDGVTMNAAGVTVIAPAPVVSKHVNVYLDTTSGGIGGTLVTRMLSIDFSGDGYYGPLWTLNRANASWAAHVDLVPKNTFKMLVEADATGMGYLAHLQSGATVYLRVDAAGTTIDVPNSLTQLFRHDFAAKIVNVSEFKDDQGVYAIEYEMEVAEDTAWGSGKAQTVTVQNLLATL